MKKMKSTAKRYLIIFIIISLFLILIPVPALADETNNTSTSYTYVASSLYPSPVKFRVQTLTGAPVCNMSINATAYNSTTGDDFISAVLSLWGIADDGEEIGLTLDTMNGETGTDGSIVFLMFSSYKYHITFNHPGYEADPITIYPNSAEYFILVTPKSQPNIATDIKFNLSASEISENTYKLGLYYNDSSLTTTSVLFFVKADRYNSEGDIITETLYESTTHANLVETSYEINDEYGKNATLPYYWGFSATSTAFKKPITQVKEIRFKHILVGDEIGAFWLQCGSIVVLVLISGLGSYLNIKETLLTLVILAGLFKFFQWFQITGNEYLDWSIIALAFVIAILHYLKVREKEERL